MYRLLYAGLLLAVASWGAAIQITSTVYCVLDGAPCPEGLVQFRDRSEHYVVGNQYLVSVARSAFGEYEEWQEDHWQPSTENSGILLVHQLNITAQLRTGGRPRTGLALIEGSTFSAGSTDAPRGYIAGPWGCVDEFSERKHTGICGAMGNFWGWYAFPLGTDFKVTAYGGGLYRAGFMNGGSFYGSAYSDAVGTITLYEADGVTPVSIYVVPEPTTSALAVSGLALLLATRRKWGKA